MSQQNLFPQELQNILAKALEFASEIKSEPTLTLSQLFTTIVKEEFSGFTPSYAFFHKNGIVPKDLISAVVNQSEKGRGSVKFVDVTVVPHEIASVIASSTLLVKDLGLSSNSNLILLFASLKHYELQASSASFSPSEFTEFIDALNLEISEGGSRETLSSTDFYAIYKSALEGDSDTPVAEENIFASLEDDTVPEDGDDNGDNTATQQRVEVKSTPALDLYSFNLSAQAAEGKLDPIIGRKTEVERMLQILSRKKKNNPVLVGEPGVGKTAIVEGLALRIFDGEVPESMLEKEVRSLDLPGLTAGTKFRGEFEERIVAIIKELTENPHILLFMDEIHTLVGAGNSTGGLDAANILKPALARGTVQCIGATTFKEYKESIEKDGALERRFQKIKVAPSTPEETFEILSRLKSTYGDHHSVVYTDEAIQACIDYSIKYDNSRHLPDKAIDIMDEVGSKLNLKNMKGSSEIKQIQEKLDETLALKDEEAAKENYEEAGKLRANADKLIELKEATLAKLKEERNTNRVTVQEEDIAEVIHQMTGIPVTKLSSSELDKMRSLADTLKKNLIGQDEAVDSVCASVKRNRLGFDESGKPIAVFLFSGPTGVGKTQLAKELAKEVFHSEENLIRIDMSEYTSRHEVSRLIGAAPGYVGYEEGGKLTEAVRKKPYSIILLDELEKAHKDVFNIFLQVFDDGILTDGSGRTVDFSNTIIIMTSNVGSRSAASAAASVGFGANTAQSKEEKSTKILDSQLKGTFSPEFLNRLDGVVRFNYLTEENITSILELDLTKAKSKYNKSGYTLTFDKKAKDFLVSKGFQKEFGARPLKRAVNKYVDDLMVEALLEGKLEGVSALTITHRKGADTLNIKVPKEKKA